MARLSKRQRVDILCREWAKVRRQLLGLDDPQRSKDYLGTMHSTLGQRRDLHAGSRSNKVEQHWPEVYTGEAAVVNQAFKALSPRHKQIMDCHYVYHGDVDTKAELLCVSKSTYFDEVSGVRAFVEGWIARTEVG